MAKDRKGVKSVQKELKGELRRAKKGYKEKIEGKLEDNNTWEVWDGLKKITGQKQSGLDEGWGQDRANELNLFFNRFDVPPPTPTPPAGRVSQPAAQIHIQDNAPQPPPPPSTRPLISRSQMEQFSRELFAYQRWI
ncbi:hypothetical protein AAFF_G00291600 [Aldrovandia affinis]|uniref:Uncharacterized protein n=1 Tax=Aldrovandia affinis TaxID=143900 RepID=A0AAD7SQ69_9TELE|nr:hypothetical protein AAFF_G00291600 [Aldrovandia affinis]